jgi:dTDP-4-amino-4,6-dideoxygalactose transaminase
MIKFVARKSLDMTRIATLLQRCDKENQWANRGPLFYQLAAAYSDHFGLSSDRVVTPCANAGIALEAMARRLSQIEKRPLRWVGSAFSFQNLARGYFADMQLVDCTPEGLMDLDAVRSLKSDSFDGIVVVNPFGHFRDFSAYIRFAQETDKHLIFDNAAGVDSVVPDWPWQAFSLHHTKPYGVGEGGLAITPASEAEPFYALLNYGLVPENSADWLNNGKISDISCAFLIDRLENVGTWRPWFHEQAVRVAEIAAGLGLHPLRPVGDAAPAMSWAFITPKPIPLDRVLNSTTLVFGKYYKPLAPLPNTLRLFDHLLNIPTHPDVGQLTNHALRSAIVELL